MNQQSHLLQRGRPRLMSAGFSLQQAMMVGRSVLTPPLEGYETKPSQNVFENLCRLKPALRSF